MTQLTYCQNCGKILDKKDSETLCIKCLETNDKLTFKPKIRKFATGATRDIDTDKMDYEGFLSPIVLKRFALYMNKHRVQPDGNLRASDNWQRGIPKDAYIKSAWRHFMDWWLEHRGYDSRDGLDEALCALMFNVMGYLYELLKEREKEKE